ncbi:response regulator [Halobacteriovorax sp. JY17]|uniref:response regulator transcription factor n=1 Tax=Halobacteriovorax sp. JY17 TaxID=2014617 RepID=UPI000C48218F|nr:response regulator [Halobacteriovorax sp. JY17]PIK15025.1 MAG: transcriptional regulator [Halobacteriovorax sp. JY17]
MKKVLIVDDDKNFCESLSLEFKDLGHQVSLAYSIADLEEIEELELYDWAVVDLRIGTDNGLEVVDLLKKINSGIEVIILTGFGSISTAVEAVKRGAKQYLSKPVQFEEILENFEGDSLSKENEAYPSLARKEREYIEFVLNECEGNISLAAKKLGIHRQSLQRKLKKYTPLK